MQPSKAIEGKLAQAPKAVLLILLGVPPTLLQIIFQDIFAFRSLHYFIGE